VAFARILVVDDEARTRWSLRERLTAEDYDVFEAGLASDALARLSSTTIDVVLLDFTLPDGDGLALLERVRELSADTEVIMLMGSPDLQDALAAMRRGANHYMIKPLDLDEAVIRVQRALEVSNLRRQIRDISRL
jgi:DNA-binding NtrC family response regulator